MRRTHVIACAALAIIAACARPVRMATAPDSSVACREPVSNAADSRISWIRPDDPEQRRALDARCLQVGPPLVVRGTPVERPVTRLAVVTWNLHDGRGDVPRLLRDLRHARHGAPAPDAVVLLLQEYVRVTVPGRAADVPATIASLGWHLAYLPARRTTVPGDARGPADRGTAILSSLPLTDLQAIELPIERQRRLALAVTVQGVTAGGRAWRARVVNVHLENRPGAGRLWVRAAAARTRQAEALVDALDLEARPEAGSEAGAFILGGDLNTWLGRRERAWQIMRDAFPRWEREDVRPTIGFGLRLDHLFARLPAGARAVHRRIDDRYGSDHHPVVAAIDFGAH